MKVTAQSLVLDHKWSRFDSEEMVIICISLHARYHWRQFFNVVLVMVKTGASYFCLQLIMINKDVVSLILFGNKENSRNDTHKV